MRSWQIILSGFLPYFIAMSILLSILYSYHTDYFTFGIMVNVVFGALPIYCFTILPWYYVIYLMRHHYGTKAFYLTGLVFVIMQPIVCGLVLGAPFNAVQFWLLVIPVLGSGILIFMICMIVFLQTKERAS